MAKAKPRTPSPAPSSVKAAAVQSQDGRRVTIRMYRQGLGDCFLVFLHRGDGKAPYKIMIDCGVIIGTKDAAATMTRVVNNIADATDGQVDLLIATHQHWDHLSGFIQAEDVFKERLSFDQVWVAWTEDPEDDLANKLRKSRKATVDALRSRVEALRSVGAMADASDTEGLLDFFGAASGRTTQDAMDKVTTLGKVRYCKPGEPPTVLRDPAATFYVLGPPHEEKALRNTLGSRQRPEAYELAALEVDGGVTSALGEQDDGVPFGPMRAIPYDLARTHPFFVERYWGPSDNAPAWRQIEGSWLDGTTELALALDNATNNTSLVLAIEFPDGDVLLFAADAQVGNWLSWQKVEWPGEGRSVTGPDLLKRTIFYKVGHHGSPNATLRALGLDTMARLQAAAIPVDHEMALKKRWGKLPFDGIVADLEAKARIVLRSDQSPDPVPDGVVVDKDWFDITL